MNEIPDLECRLENARARLKRASAALAPKHKGGEWEEYHAADQEVLLLERHLAAARGEEYAEPCYFPLKWDIGAPMPQLLVNDYRAFLAFLVRESDPNWDGSYVTIKSARDQQSKPLGLVEFEHCISARLGAPNDEVFEGHPLNGKGLEAYQAQRVVNSRWLKEIEAINSVHHMYRPESWQDLSHYIFWFHDSTFECIARSFKVESHRMSMKELLGLMVERLVA
ncbi:MAG: hypothetical protein AB7I37_12045 [Pirellulales bacterium]